MFEVWQRLNLGQRHCTTGNWLGVPGDSTHTHKKNAPVYKKHTNFFLMNAPEFGCASDDTLEGLMKDLKVAQIRMENHISSHPESCGCPCGRDLNDSKRPAT